MGSSTTSSGKKEGINSQCGDNIEVKDLRRISWKRNANSYAKPAYDIDAEETEEYVIVPTNEPNEIVLSAAKRSCETMASNVSRLVKFDDTTLNNVGNASTTTITESTDEFNGFGQFIANELRGLKEPKHVRKLKRMIQKAIIEISDLDDTDD